MKKKLFVSGCLVIVSAFIALAAGDTGGVQVLKDGTHVGRKTTDKLGFYNATPVTQPANTLSARAVLQLLGFQAAGGTAPPTAIQAGSGSGTYVPSGRLYSTGTAVNTGANTTETDGATYTLPANTLSANGQALRFRVFGTTGATGNNKTVQIYWGGTSVFTTGAVAANNKPWFLNVAILRTGAGAQAIFVEGQFNATAVAAVTTATKDETTALILKNTMTNGTAAAADATTSGGSIEYLP